MLNKIKIFNIEEINLDKIYYTNIDTNNKHNIQIINMLYIYNNKKVPLLVQIDDLYMMDDIIEIDNGSTINYEIILPLISNHPRQQLELKISLKN